MRAEDRIAGKERQFLEERFDGFGCERRYTPPFRMTFGDRAKRRDDIADDRRGCRVPARARPAEKQRSRRCADDSHDVFDAFAAREWMVERNEHGPDLRANSAGSPLSMRDQFQFVAVLASTPHGRGRRTPDAAARYVR